MCRFCGKRRKGSWAVAAAPRDDPYSLLNVSRGASRDEVGCASGPTHTGCVNAVWAVHARGSSCAGGSSCAKVCPCI